MRPPLAAAAQFTSAFSLRRPRLPKRYSAAILWDSAPGDPEDACSARCPGPRGAEKSDLVNDEQVLLFEITNGVPGLGRHIDLLRDIVLEFLPYAHGEQGLHFAGIEP